MEISITEYAKKVNKTRQTVYNWIKAGKVQTKDCCGVMKIYVGDQGNVKGGADSSHESIQGAESPEHR